MTTLTDRYVWAAARTLPEAQRAEFDRELRERIGDVIDARVERGAAPADAEHAALVELGDPLQLAASYVDRPLQLIGPKYFLTWWRLLKLLLVVVVPLAAAGVLLGQVIAGAAIGEMIGTTIGTATPGRRAPRLLDDARVRGARALAGQLGAGDHVDARAASAACATTPAPGDSATSSPRSCSSCVFAVVIVWQQFGIVWIDGERLPIPMLDPALWSFWIP